MNDCDERNRDADGIEPERGGLVRSLVADAALAFGLLSRFPVTLPDQTASLSRAVWAFPIVGAAIGAAGGAVYVIVRWAGFDPLIGCIGALIALVVWSGALHEDGLADFFDGVGGGSDRERRLDIMRDSRIGTYGVLSLAFVLSLQGALLWSLARVLDSGQVWAAIVCVAMVSRAALIIPMGLLPPAREDGLGAGVTGASMTSILVVVVIAGVASTLLVGLVATFVAMCGAISMSALVSALARQYLGGQTGDVLGASVCFASVGALAGLVVYLV